MIELKVSGMNCGGCVKAVGRAVERVLPGAKPDIDLASGRLRVNVSSMDLERVRGEIIAAIEAAGFGAAVWEP